MESLSDFIKLHENVLKLTDTNRIQCLLTGHEMPPDLETIRRYLDSKSYRKAASWYSKDYSMYLPYLVPHKSGDPKKVFCVLTKKTLNKIPDQVEKHVNGKQFKR
jgi:hypothetical protein